MHARVRWTRWAVATFVGSIWIISGCGAGQLGSSRQSIPSRSTSQAAQSHQATSTSTTDPVAAGNGRVDASVACRWLAPTMVANAFNTDIDSGNDVSDGLLHLPRFDLKATVKQQLLASGEEDQSQIDSLVATIPSGSQELWQCTVPMAAGLARYVVTLNDSEPLAHMEVTNPNGLIFYFEGSAADQGTVSAQPRLGDEAFLHNHPHVPGYPLWVVVRSGDTAVAVGSSDLTGQGIGGVNAVQVLVQLARQLLNATE